MQIPEVVLSSGHKLPMIGFGTAAVPLPPSETLVPVFVDAIQVGYRHFDTAALYGTEEALGQAVAEAIKRGLIKGREELFITSKLWCTAAHQDLVLPALEKTLRGTWEAMEECSKLGLAKAIGVSNFGTKKLSQLLQHATIPPAVNQVEMHVAWQQKKLVGSCKEKGIQVTAWSPLGANGAAWGTLAVMGSPVLKEIAAAKGKSVAQIALRWIYEQGVCPIVKSFNKERMTENLQIFDWELTEEELHKIEQIPQFRGQNVEAFVHKDGPYKTLEELWDDDS